VKNVYETYFIKLLPRTYFVALSSISIFSVDRCFVPSDALVQLARNRNLDSSQILKYGLPIRQGFWSSTPTSASQVTSAQQKVALRNSLRVATDLPTVLVVGGGDGMGGIVDIAKSLGETLGSASSSPAYQMVVVCGNNRKAKEALSDADFGPGVQVSIQGFVNNMDEWMRASDALVTKAGPGTIAEASICGLPCMLFSYL
jgi:1,2-diacylglycerol 3-beta-galactosyltransferase